MVYQVKYGAGQYLRYGRVSDRPTTYYHPGTAETARRNFERRFSERKNEGVIQIIKNGEAVDIHDEIR